MDGERENVSVYVVKEGDNVDRIAETASIPVGELLWANQIEYPIPPGCGPVAPDSGRTGGGPGTVQAGAILIWLCISVYFKGDGGADASVSDRSLYFFLRLYRTGKAPIPPSSDDTWLIRQAADAGVDPVIVLTPLGADGRFNNNLVTALMEDRRLQERLIWELGRTMTEKGYRGLDIHLEYVRAEDEAGLCRIYRPCAPCAPGIRLSGLCGPGSENLAGPEGTFI